MWRGGIESSTELDFLDGWDWSYGMCSFVFGLGWSLVAHDTQLASMASATNCMAFCFARESLTNIENRYEIDRKANDAGWSGESLLVPHRSLNLTGAISFSCGKLTMQHTTLDAERARYRKTNRTEIWRHWTSMQQMLKRTPVIESRFICLVLDN